MRIEATLRRRRPLSLTSLIDVIFLLLLFFMLSSTFTRFASVEITGGPASATASSTPPDVMIRLEEGQWTVNGVGIEPEHAVAEIGRLVEAGAKTGVILVRDGVTSQALVTAVERVRRATGLEISVAR